VSSTSGTKGFPWFTPYVAAKHGVVGIMKSLANELSEHHIRVNSIHPTGVRTMMADGLQAGLSPLITQSPKLGAFFENTYPVDVVEPSDVSRALIFLASDD
jgi:NAD(P)-dependent dehydrogenase (short-subunit alcohol dehydrogenase family)